MLNAARVYKLDTKKGTNITLLCARQDRSRTFCELFSASREIHTHYYNTYASMNMYLPYWSWDFFLIFFLFLLHLKRTISKFSRLKDDWSLHRTCKHPVGTAAQLPLISHIYIWYKPEAILYSIWNIDHSELYIYIYIHERLSRGRRRHTLQISV